MKMNRLILITSTLLCLDIVSADMNNPQLKCNEFVFYTNSTSTIMTQGYPTEKIAWNCSNYFPYHTNSSLIIFELEDINMYYTHDGIKVCDAIAIFGTYSIPCLEDDSMCVVYTNDRYCLSSGLPKRYSQCMIIYSGIHYVPVHMRFKGRYGVESECVNPNEPRSTCRKIHRKTFPRGIKTQYLQTYCRKPDGANNAVSRTTSSTPTSLEPVSTPDVQDKALGPDKPNSDSGEVQDDTGRNVIMFSLIGISAILIAVIIVGLTKRYRFKNKRARKRMVRNQSSTATMVNSIIYGSTPEFPSSAVQSPDGTSMSAVESSTTNLQSEDGDYCYIDFDMNKNADQGKFRFPCQYRREGVSYIPNDERKNALYEEARSFA